MIGCTIQSAGAVFNGITENGEFACGILYQIEDTGTQMKLIPVDSGKGEPAQLHR